MTTPAPKPTREVLEESLARSPRDLALHAAYADLLAEQGDPRGEYIRLQLELERRDTIDDEYRRIEKRAKELLEQHGEQWRAGLERILPYLEPSDAEFQLGWVRRLFAMVIGGKEAVALAALPELRLLRSLRVTETSGDRSPLPPRPATSFLGNVKVFRFGFEPKYGGRAEEGNSPVLVYLAREMPRLRSLSVFAQHPDAASLFALPNLTRLRFLAYHRGDNYPLEVLAANPALRRLEKLSCHPRPLVSGPPYIGLPQIEAIANSPHLKRLTHLRLRMSNFGDAGCEAIARSGILKRLQVLDLALGTITDAGVRTLLAADGIRSLKRLDLRKNAISDAGNAALKELRPGVEVRDWGQHEPGDDQYLYEGDWE